MAGTTVFAGSRSRKLLAPIVTGYLVDWTGSYTWPFIVAAALLFIGSGVTTVLSRRPLQPAGVAQAVA